MAEPTDLECRVALAIARLYTDDPRAEARAEHLIPHARAAIAECFKWQPIETAPNDEDVLCLAPTYAVPLMLKSNSGWLGFLYFYDWDGDRHYPTHWLPLPEVPDANPAA